MLRLSTHIERVLLVNDCVIVPDFGGFVLQRCPAVYAAEEHAFYPAHKEIAFNPTLNHNDGLLTESYMEMYGINFNEARMALEQDVRELKELLDEHREGVSLGIIGLCRKNDEGALLFEPERDTLLYNLNTYGLTMFHMAPVESERKRQEAAMAKTIAQEQHFSRQSMSSDKRRRRKMPVPLRIAGQMTAVAAAACVLFFLITIPVRDVDEASYMASFIPSEMTNLSAGSREKKEMSSTRIQDKKDVSLSAKQSVSDSISFTPLLTEPEQADDDRVMSLQSEMLVEKTSRGAYYVIIASFDSKRRALQFVSEIDPKECPHIGIVKSEDKIRVYADKYDKRVEAESYMLELRKIEKFKSSWLFIGR